MAEAVEIVPADDVLLAAFYGGYGIKGRWIGRAAKRGRLIAAFGGVIETKPGEWIAFLDVPTHLRKPILVRHMVRGMEEAKALGAKVFKTTCNTDIPRAEALLRHFGFEPTDEMHDGRRVWACPVSN